MNILIYFLLYLDTVITNFVVLFVTWFFWF